MEQLYIDAQRVAHELWAGYGLHALAHARKELANAQQDGDADDVDFWRAVWMDLTPR